MTMMHNINESCGETINNFTDNYLKDTVFHISSLSQLVTFIVSFLTLGFNFLVVAGLQTHRGTISAVLYNQLMSLCICDLTAGVISAFHCLTLIPYVNQSTIACISILFLYNVSQYAVLLNLSFISYRRWRFLKQEGSLKFMTYQRSTICAWFLSFVCNLPSLASFSMKASTKGCPNPGLFVNGLILYTFPLYFITLFTTDVLYVHMIFIMKSFHRRRNKEMDIQLDEIKREIFCTLKAAGVSKFLNLMSLAIELSHVMETIKHSKTERKTREIMNGNVRKDGVKRLLPLKTFKISEELQQTINNKGIGDNENTCKTDAQDGTHYESRKSMTKDNCYTLLSSETVEYLNERKALDPSAEYQHELNSLDTDDINLSAARLKKTEEQHRLSVNIEMERVHMGVPAESDTGGLKLLSICTAEKTTHTSLIAEKEKTLYGCSSVYSSSKETDLSLGADGEVTSQQRIMILSSSKEQNRSDQINDDSTQHHAFIRHTEKCNGVETTRSTTDFSQIYPQPIRVKRNVNEQVEKHRRNKSSSRRNAVITLLLTTLTANVATILHSIIFFTSKKCYEGNEFVCTYHIIALNSLLNPFLYSVTVKAVRCAVKENFMRLKENMCCGFRRT